MKKLLAVLLAILMLGGVMAVGASAVPSSLPGNYEVDYDDNAGGIIPVPAPSGQFPIAGPTILLDAAIPVRAGYKFMGWSKTTTGPVDFAPNDPYTDKIDATLYAVWATLYAVTYDANGGAGAPAADTKIEGVTLALSATVPTYTGRIFKGWATSATGPVVYAAGDNYIADAALNLFAVWELETYAITYDANGGAGAPAAQTKTFGTPITLDATVPTYTGNIFKGWATTATGAVAYAAGDNYAADAALNLFAVWELETYAVTYDANGGAGAPAAQTKTFGTPLTLDATVPTYTVYTFKGWATTATGAVAYAAGASYTADAALNLFAVWEAITYTVTYDANGGVGAPNAQTKAYGAAITLDTAVPVYPGYTFKGWSTAATGTTVDYAPGASYAADANVTLYAVWEKLPVRRGLFQWLMAPVYLIWFVIRTVIWLLFGWIWIPFPHFWW